MAQVPPGGTLEYTYRIRADHAPGTCWYHPHGKGSKAVQVNSGLAGALIIEDEFEPDLIGPPHAGPPPHASTRWLGELKEVVLVLQNANFRTSPFHPYGHHSSEPRSHTVLSDSVHLPSAHC